jgi:hypothetical protein
MSDPAEPGDRPPAPVPAARPGGADPAIRASDAERDQAIERLRGAAGEGRLTLEELTDRVEAASSAQTRGDLETLVRDLPAEGATGAPGAVGAPAAGAIVSVPTRNSAVFGDLRRAGAWRVAQRSRWDSVFGDVKLDLREAQVSDAEVEIEAGTVFGDIELLVPEGVVVEVRARTFFGDVKQDAGEAAPAGAPRIVLTGWTTFGDVRVRSRRLRERFAERWLG